MSKDYNKTLNLPQTEFSMRAALPKREPSMVDDWNTNGLYYEMIKRNEGKPKYILHDGPPYANGDIHLGTALNKVLKDIIIRNKNMSGFHSPYVPGWDTHGLPIELKAMKSIGVENIKSAVDLRKHCKDFALSFVESQKNQFRRLGVLADFNNPYLTLRPEFDARQVEIFGEMANKGYIYKGLKPVHWCPECNTALAEAEIEYAEDPCYSIYVKFQVKNDQGKLANAGVDLSKTYFVIWTTTTWTLPGNMAVCLGPNYEYSLVKADNGENYVIATELMEETMKAGNIENYEVVATYKGSDLERIVCNHPFIDRESLVIVGDHVTLESGTGCVHTAPGHGVEDFEVCVNHYPEIKIIVPVDAKGKLTKEANQFEGLTTDEANKAIGKHLEEIGSLFAIQKIIHQYPHCWRCKSPVIFRATEQWFCSIDGFKDDALNAIESVKWIPGWGEERIKNMVRDRSDWCISRQRTWGVPIPVFYCEECGKYHVSKESINAVSELFRKEGSDSWYIKSAEEILPDTIKCEYCGSKKFRKETDIMDVWFDSGVTHAAVLEEREELNWPSDLVLEGNDQYRGWFQSSLLTAVAWRGLPPYKAVCTHGWVVDGEGRKMSKSVGNGIAPEDIINEYGADILRLWVASSDYHSDIRISTNILKQLSEVYRKIRNTARFILGNLFDFDPSKDMVADDKLKEIDVWALMQLDKLEAKINKAYEDFDFHIIYHSMHNFCTIDMSTFYLDVLKDRLYVEKADSETRRAAQTTMYKILRSITLMLAPIIPFTCEEIWSFIPEDKNYNSKSVTLNDIPKATGNIDVEFMAKWDRIHVIRDDVNKALELARSEKTIGKSLEAKVTLHATGELYDFITALTENLTEIFIVSASEVVNDDKGSNKFDTENLSITVSKADGEKCERCWMYSDTVGQDNEDSHICARCASVLK